MLKNQEKNKKGHSKILAAPPALPMKLESVISKLASCDASASSARILAALINLIVSLFFDTQKPGKK
jgi:hypothetical protein